MTCRAICKRIHIDCVRCVMGGQRHFCGNITQEAKNEGKTD